MRYSAESVDHETVSPRTALLILCAVLATASCTTRNSFSGSYVGNDAASVMPPGQQVPPNFRLFIEDDGVVIKNVQTFTADSGETVRLVWQGECDGKERPVEGALQPDMRLSCRRSAVWRAGQHGFGFRCIRHRLVICRNVRDGIESAHDVQRKHAG